MTWVRLVFIQGPWRAPGHLRHIIVRCLWLQGVHDGGRLMNRSVAQTRVICQRRC